MTEEKLWDILLSVKQNCFEQEEKIKKKLGLTDSEYRGLAALDFDEKISCQEFSLRLSLSLSRGSRVIDRLFAAGFLNRADCSADRRCKRLWLTSKGKKVRIRIAQDSSDCEDKITKKFSKSRLESLKNELRKLNNEMKEITL